MRIISKRRLREFWEKHPAAQQPLEAWHRVAEGASWLNFRDIRETFATVSGVPLDCGLTAIVFNIAGNNYRLITRVEYRFHVIYVKMVLTHREYDRNRWKDELCRQ
jgi:mRNA interferase HigB